MTAVFPTHDHNVRRGTWLLDHSASDTPKALAIRKLTANVDWFDRVTSGSTSTAKHRLHGTDLERTIRGNYAILGPALQAAFPPQPQIGCGGLGTGSSLDLRSTLLHRILPLNHQFPLPLLILTTSVRLYTMCTILDASR